MKALRVLGPDDYIGAVEAISEITDGDRQRCSSRAPPTTSTRTSTSRSMRAGGSATSPNYDRATMLRLFAERGGDPDHAGKRDPLDSLLWRGFRYGEPFWDTELGRGRPGWHIECSVIALNRLGTGFDVQGGGSDLIFPHHEHSSAHAEALTGEHPFARAYVHTGMIGLDGEKMSKSRGNLVFVSKLRGAGVDPMAIRLALLDGHYRADREWTGGRLPAAEERLARWRAAGDRHQRPERATALLEAVRARLADDLDTPGAIAAIDRWVDAALRQRRGGDAAAPQQVARPGRRAARRSTLRAELTARLAGGRAQPLPCRRSCRRVRRRGRGGADSARTRRRSPRRRSRAARLRCRAPRGCGCTR